MSALFKVVSATHTWLYRKTGGKLGSRMMGQDVVLLTTTGRKSGQQRTVPIMAFQDDGRLYVIASAGGSPQHPAWFNNLAANSSVTWQLGPTQSKGTAVVVPEPERTRLYAKVASQMQNFAEYEKKAAGRKIPIVELQPAA